MTHSPRRSTICGVKALPSMMPRIMIIPDRSPTGTRIGMPSMETVVQNTMDPIIQASGNWNQANSAPPAAPSTSVKASTGRSSRRMVARQDLAWGSVIARSAYDTAQPDGRLTAPQAARRHDQHAVVIGRSYLGAVVAGDQSAFSLDDLHADIVGLIH